MKPTAGRIVHYVLNGPSFDGVSTNNHEHRPAIVVSVRNDLCVNLQVFTDGPNDRPNSTAPTEGVLWRANVLQDEETQDPGTWHWPEREE